MKPDMKFSDKINQLLDAQFRNKQLVIMDDVVFRETNDLEKKAKLAIDKEKKRA